MTNYSKSLYNVPQTEPIFGENQVKNSAGGYAYKLDDWKILDRFLILGSENNTYYSTSKKLTIKNAQTIVDLIQKDGKKVVQRAIEISDEGRAPKNDPAIFVLALAMTYGDIETRKYAYSNLDRICRIGTHLFQFVEDINNMRGWGRGLKRAVANWYTEKDLDTLVYQLIKYKQRSKWSHRDVLRLAHPKPKTGIQSIIFSGVINGFDPKLKLDFYGEDTACERFFIGLNIGKLSNGNIDKVIEYIKEYNLPREVIPTEMLNDPKIWMTLLENNMPLTAMIRNLGKMSSVGILEPFSNASKIVINTLTNENIISKARIHPINVLSAKSTYDSGQGVRGSNNWRVNNMISAALEDCFYLSFGNVIPSNKNTMVALDVSGSMFWSYIQNNPNLSCALISAAMAMTTVRTEPNCIVLGFSDKLVPIEITKKSSLIEIISKMKNIPMGRTDCAIPMIYAKQNKIPVEAFTIWTDNETYCGNIHPSTAIKDFRNFMGIDAKLIVAGVTATEFTIADPKDSGMLDIVGFDSAVPQLITEFINGTI